MEAANIKYLNELHKSFLSYMSLKTYSSVHVHNDIYFLYLQYTKIC